MFLCVDIGNTNIVLGIVKDRTIIETYRLETNVHITEDEYFQKINCFTKDYDIDDAVVSSVVPQLDQIFNIMFLKYYKFKAMFIGPGLKSGLKLKIENPKELGADLLCDAVGATTKYGSPVVIADYGTATKFIVVNKENEYLGGSILPGIKGSLNSLISNAAKLSQTALLKPSKVIGNNTATCIQSGMIYGYASLTDGMLSLIKEELKEDNVNVILTGGLSPLIKDVIKEKHVYDPDILLYGLIVLYYKNKKVE